MKNIITISKIVLKESIRDKIFIGLLLFLALFFVFSVYISTLSLGTEARFIKNTGMLGISLICLTVTILFGLFSLYREKDRNELYVLLNRIPRHTYILGRFLGTSYIIALFSFFTGVGIFALTWIFGNSMAPELSWAAYWALLEFTLLLGVGFLFYSLGVSFTLNALLLLAVYVVGHSMTEAIQSFIGLGRFGNPYHLQFVKICSYLFPNFDMFDFRLPIVHGETLPTGRILLSTGYWFFYLTAILSVGISIFKRRDI